MARGLEGCEGDGAMAYFGRFYSGGGPGTILLRVIQTWTRSRAYAAESDQLLGDRFSYASVWATNSSLGLVQGWQYKTVERKQPFSSSRRAARIGPIQA